MAKPPPPRGPVPKPPLDPKETYAPPHHAGGFDTGAFNAGAFGGGPDAAPEPPLRVSLDIKTTRTRVTQAPPPVTTLRGDGVVIPTRNVSQFDRAAITRHARALIAAFEEIEAYDPQLRHNSKPPALWSDDPDYRRDIKALLGELRRLNDLLESEKDLSPSAVQKIGKSLTLGASIVFKAACGTIGVGLGTVILCSFAEILSQLGLRNELTQILSWLPKAK